MQMIDNVKHIALRGRAHLRKYGLLSFVRTLFQQLGFQCFDKTLVFLECDLRRLPSIDASGYSLRELTVRDVEDKGDSYDDGFFSREKAVRRLIAGHRLYTAQVDDSGLGSFAWVERRKATVWWFDDLPVTLPNDMALLAAVYTPPGLRGRGLATRIEMEVFRRLSQEGIRSVVFVVHPNNSVSLRIQERLGCRPYQVVRYTRFWLFRKYVITKYDSSESTKVITLSRSRGDVWRLYLPRWYSDEPGLHGSNDSHSG